MASDPNGTPATPPPANPANLIPAPAQARPALSLDPTRFVELLWSSIPTDDPAGKALMMKAMGESDIKSEDILNKPYAVRHVLIHEAEKTDVASGEVFTFPRAVLVNDKGQTVAFGSKGILKWLGRICGIYGAPPWDPPLIMEIYPVKTGNGFRTFNIRIVGEPPIEAAPAGKGGRRG